MDASAEELALYLGRAEIDGTRAEFLLEQAIMLAGSIISPVPDSAKPVVLAAAGRAYSNPQGVSQESVGPYSVQRPQAGLYFTRAEQAILKRLGGRGGAFTVDPTPVDVDPDVTWPFVPEDPGPLWDDEPGWERL